jgi:hypothetical protein
MMEPGLSLSTHTETAPSTASYQSSADLCDPRAPEERHIWPTAVSRTPPTHAILQPLSFPEIPKEDLSLFTDPSKDQPIYCLVCDQTFSSSDCDSLSRSEQAQHLGTKLQEGHSDMAVALKDDKKDMVESWEGPGEREKEESAVTQLQPKDEWLRHLLLEHKIVIHRVSEICSLKWYGQ